jgi:LPXTG-motif cell wall-anchored protein
VNARPSLPSERKTTRVRQTLSKGLIVAAATTGALSLCAPWAIAAPAPLRTAETSTTALAGGIDDWVSLDQVQNLGDEMQSPFEQAASRMEQEASSSASSSASASSSSSSDKADSSGYGAEETSGYGAEETSGYGAEEPSGYGPEEPSGSCECHTPPPEPTPSRNVTPPDHTTPPKTPPHHTTPPKTPPAPPTKPRPQLPETGAESVVGGLAASGALLVAGTVLYRRGRAAAQS